MGTDKLLHSRVGHKIDTELLAFLFEKRLHHSGEQRGQTLAQIIARSGKFLDGYSIEQRGVASVQPPVVRGA